MSEKQLLLDFFKFFRDNGEKFIGMPMEEFIEMFLKNRNK